MNLDDVLHQHCLDDAGLKRLVADRIYPDFAPASAELPYVVRSLVSDPRQEHLAGEAAIGNPTYQFTVYAASNRQRTEVAGALRACLSRYSGPMGDLDVEVSSPEVADDVAAANDGSDRRVFARRMDFEIWHSREPVERRTL